MEYIFTNLPQYVKINSRSEFSSSVVSSGAVLLFSEDGYTLTGKLPDGTFITIGGSSGTDVGSTTAEAGDVLSGKIFFTSGGVMTSGTIPTVSATLAANVTTVPSGYIASSQQLTVPEASSATVAGGIVTIPAGYVASAYTVSAGGGGATDFYKCATVTSGGSTWTGYKAVLSNGVYSFESTVTSGLTYTSVTPEVSKVYADGALVKASLYQGIWVGNLLNAPMDSSVTTSGDQLEIFSQTVTYNVTTDGITGAVIQYGSVKFPLNAIPASFTLSGWVKATSVYSSSLLALGRDEANCMASIWLENGALHIEYASGGSSAVAADTPENWHHYALTKSGNTFTLYVDGVQVITDTNSSNNITDKHVYISGMSDGSYPVYTVEEAYYSYVRLHDHALSAAEIAQLAAEFTPSAA